MSEVLNLKFNGQAGVDTAMEVSGSDYVTITNDSALDLGSGDWTVECWMKETAATATQSVIDLGTYSASQALNITLSSGLPYCYWTGGMGTVNFSAGLTRSPIGTWNHIAIVSDGGTVYAYYNGVASSTTGTVGSGDIDIGAADPEIGRFAAGTYANAKYRNFRISSIARYESGTSFTPSREDLVDDVSTIFLAKFDEAVGAEAWTDSSTNTLTMTQGGSAIQSASTSWKNASWLEDSSDSGHVATAVADAKVVLPAIENKRQAYFFDGDSDYLTLPDSADWDLFADDTQDYTIDFFAKFGDHAGDEQPIGQYQNTSNFWSLLHRHGSGFRLSCAIGNVIIVTTDFGGEIKDTGWHHIAICKVTSAGSTVEWGIYVDGVQACWVSDASEGNITGALGIGWWYSGTTRYFNGHMKNIRIQKSNIFSAAPVVGKTDTITVPTATPTADANTVLLLHGSAPAGLNAPISSALSFDGSSHLVVPDSSDWDFSGDFTVEGWFRLNSISTNNMLLGNCDYDGGSDGWTLDYNNNGNLLFQGMYSGGWGVNHVEATGGLVANRWYHIAVVRSGTTLTSYVDGVSIGDTTDSGPTAITGATYDLYIGVNPTGTQDWNGYMRNIRISDSARYTADFTPSTTAFSDDANTKLLILGSDGVPNSLSVVTDMTSNSDPSPQVASADGEYSAAYAAYKAFNGNFTSDNWDYSGGSYPHWLKIDLGSGNEKIITAYSLTEAGSTTYSPTAWTFDGSNNDSDWTTLDTVSAFSGASGLTTRFEATNTTAYRYYRLYFSAGNAADITVRQVALYDADRLAIFGDNSSGGHLVTNHQTSLKYIEDYRNKTVVDDGNTGHTGTMVGTAKLDW